MIPVNLILYAVLAVAAIGALAKLHHDAVESGRNEVYAQWREKVQEQREAEQRRAERAAKELEDARSKRKVVYRTITKAVDRVVVQYRDRECLDADGVRYANAAISGTAPGAPGNPDRSLSPARSTERWDRGDGAAVDRVSSGAVP